jgi:ACS family D-galactonate transporter-like MFS transporter
MSVTAGLPARADRPFMSSLWTRQLDSYPDTGMRFTQLGLVVLVTIVLYYENYVGGGVGAQILANLHMSFTYYVTGLAIANLVGAFGSVAAGLADRLGRANLVVYGVLLTGVIMLFGLPNVHSELAFIVLTCAIGLVEGIVLVATPALVRDFSPQVGRATAMGFWTMGPVLGSLVVSVVATQTLPKVNPDWQGQFQICGVVGMCMFAVAFVGLRELSPGLRDQLMVSLRERALVEARAKGIDIEESLRHPWRQMLRTDVIASALGVSLMLLIYYTAVGFGTIYFETIFHFTAQQANGIGNWDWAADAVALLVVGLISDMVRVRKPFMLVGGAASAAMIAVYLLQAKGHPGYYTMVIIVSLLAISLACAYAPWMASFTETVEARNPALTATGLAVWGWIIRVVIFVAFIVLPHVVPSVTPLVSYGPQVQQDVAKYPQLVTVAAKIDPRTLATLKANPTSPAAAVKAVSELSGEPPAQVAPTLLTLTRYSTQFTTLSAIDPSTLAKLSANPNDTAAQATAVGEIAHKFSISPSAAVGRLIAVAKVPRSALVTVESNTAVVKAVGQLKSLSAVPPSVGAFMGAHAGAVQKAAGDSPGQWQTWYWICFGGVIVFLPGIFLMRGRWSPRKAAADLRAHEAQVQADLEALRQSPAGSPA